jgi:hypothetical protein
MKTDYILLPFVMVIWVALTSIFNMPWYLDILIGIAMSLSVYCVAFKVWRNK